MAEKMKKVVMLFCDETGQMRNERNIDLNSLGKIMNEQGILVSPQISQNMSSIFETFGGIQYDERVIQVEEKQEEKKALLKKDAGPKIVDVHQKLVSYQEFADALNKIKMFDVELAKLGYLKNSPALDSEMRQSKEEEEAAAVKEEKQNNR